MKAVLGLLMVTALAAAPGKATVLFGAYGGVSWIPIGGSSPTYFVAVVQFDNDKEIRDLHVSDFVTFDKARKKTAAIRIVSVERFDRTHGDREGQFAYFLKPDDTTPWDGVLPPGTIRLRVKAEIPPNTEPWRFGFTLGPYVIEGGINGSWPT
jgi:hypothetical protein